jgi:hypothetical protein
MFQQYLFSSDDHSRVILKPIGDETINDYINANYIDVSTVEPLETMPKTKPLVETNLV